MLAVLLGGAAGSAWSQARQDPPATVHSVPGKPVAEFVVQSPDGVISVRTPVDGAVGFLVRELNDREQSSRRVSWRWRVERAPPPTDPGAIGADDRPLAVHVLFRTAKPDGAWSSLKRRLRALAAGEPFAGRVITYQWGGTVARGTRLPNPYLPDDGVLIVLRGSEAPLRVWMEETVDPFADYRAAFGEEPPPPSHLAISVDTDDRGGRAEAQITRPRFHSPP